MSDPDRFTILEVLGLMGIAAFMGYASHLVWLAYVP